MNASRPHVLLIMSDQHHPRLLGCAGDLIVHTPHLDRLAAQGVQFDNAYCPSPLCGPSRMAFLAGRHPSEIECWTNECTLGSDVPTFAHAFVAAGYETVLAGRMHFVGADQRHGFQQRLVGDVPESVYLAAGWRLKRVLGDLVDTPGYSVAAIHKSGPGRTGYHAYDEKVATVAADWIHERGRLAGPDRPFLMVVGFASPHSPFVAPPADFELAARQIRLADLPADDPEVHPWLAQMKQQSGLVPPPPREAQWRARAAYYGLCSFLDRQVGRVLSALSEAGLRENTLVVYTSDHGEMLGEHGLWWKSAFYDAAAGVPFLISWPGVLPAGGRERRNVSLVDVGLTLLDLAGAAPLPAASGRSFARLCRGEAGAEWDDTVLAELANPAAGGQPVRPRRMVKCGPWKYVYYHEGGEELFNLDEDPGERANLAEQSGEAVSRKVADLRARALAGWDPASIQQRLGHVLDERRLLRAWIEATHPPEPDPLWFTEPPENWVETPVEPEQ